MQVAIVPKPPVDAGLGWATHLEQVIAGLRARGHRVAQPVVGTGDQRARVAGFTAQWQGPARPDVVLIELADAEGQSAARAALELGIPLVTSYHDLESAVAQERRERVRQAALRFHARGRATIAKTPAIAARLTAAGIAPVFVRGAGVDPARFHPRRRRQEVRASWGAAPDAPVLLSVGKLLPRKNPGLLIRVLAAVKADMPGMRAVIVGDDEVGGTIGAHLAAALPWAVLPGRVVGDALADIYASADLFVMPSLTEVWPNVLFEAGASGLACVAFARGEPLPMARVAHGDEAAFIAETLRLSRDAAARASCAAADLKAAGQHDWARVVDQVEAALTSAVAAAAAAVKPATAAAGKGAVPGAVAVLRASWSPSRPWSVYVIDGVQPGAGGGMATIVARLRAGLQARGHEVAGEAGGVMPTTGAADAAAWTAAERARLRQVWTARRPQVVHLEVLSAFTMLAQDVALGMGIPVTTAWHQVPRYVGGDGAEADEKAARMERIALEYHRRSALTFVHTEAAAKILAGHGLVTVVTPYGVDRERFSPRFRDDGLRRSWGAEASTAVVLHAGRLIPEKDPALLIATMQAAHAAGAVTVIAGEGPVRADLETALPGTVFTGRLGGDALSALFASADIFVFPGVVDLIAQAELEAMASGLALVAFARPHGDRILRDGITAVTAAMGDRAGYPAAVAALVRDLPRARAVGVAARAAMVERSWERWLDGIEAGWRSLATVPAQRSAARPRIRSRDAGSGR
jgi:glycosyltransferase involved in cell wall biosynthesis